MLRLGRAHVVGVALLLLAVASSSPSALAVDGAIDRTDKTAVILAYTGQLLPALNTDVTFSDAPDIASCDPGVESATSRNASMQAVNYYRAMTSLAPLSNYAEWNTKAQAAALIMDRNDTLTHTPDPSLDCYTAAGYEGANRSNLSYGAVGAWAVAGYMRDDGEGNEVVGHRRWLLYPRATRFGTGSTLETSALFLIDAEPPGGAWGDRPVGVSWVAWPPSGYVPWEVINFSDYSRQLDRWSLSSNDIPDADFQQANVTMTYGTENLVVTEETVYDGYGDNTLVWNARRSNGGRFAIETDAPDVTVTVSGIKDGATALPNHSYVVRPVRAVADTEPPDAPFIDYDRTIGGVSQAKVVWINPPYWEDLRGVEVRVLKGNTAPTRTTGTRVCRGLVTIPPAVRNSCTATALVPGAHHTFGVWAFDFADNHSTRTTYKMYGTTVTAAAKPTTVTRYATTKITGTLWYGPASNFTTLTGGRTVTLQYRNRIGDTWSSWTNNGTATTSGSSSFVFSRSVPRTRQYRVMYKGDEFYIGDLSPARTVTVS